MNSLRKLEESFKDCMLGNKLDMGGQVVGDARASAEERIHVYVEGYRLRLLEALRDTYGGLHAFMGDEEFDRLGRAYIDAHPSTHPSVRWFSQHLPAFLKATAPYSAHPFLAELASFEWNQGLVFDAADAEPLDMQALATVPAESWGQVRFTLHPSVRRLDLGWNAPKVWQALDAEEDPPAAQEAPASWLLWRSGLSTRWRSLSEDEAWMLDASCQGKSFGELCEGLCEWHAAESVALQAASYLKLWLTDGLVIAIGLD